MSDYTADDLSEAAFRHVSNFGFPAHPHSLYMMPDAVDAPSQSLESAPPPHFLPMPPSYSPYGTYGYSSGPMAAPVPLASPPQQQQQPQRQSSYYVPPPGQRGFEYYLGANHMSRNSVGSPAPSGPLFNQQPSDLSRPEPDMFPLLEPSLGSEGPHPFDHLPVALPAPDLHPYNPYASSYSGHRPSPFVPSGPPPAARSDNDNDVAQTRNSSRISLRARNLANSEQAARQLSSPNRRTSYERHHQQSPQAPATPERRPQSFASTPNRRSNRSQSPRTSSRRSFDRYSQDQVSGSADADAAQSELRARQARQRRIQRERLVAAHEFRRSFSDPNVPSGRQMQELRDKLRHFLPSELPGDVEPTCDICSKDYSTKHVQPTEDEEVAIQLPCKHVFGEHCINTWFETCTKHKNKITCPMCRKLLIEQPVRIPPVGFTDDLVAMMSQGRPGMGMTQMERNALERYAFAFLPTPNRRDLDADPAPL
ncbi:hypothetical protein P154DRAFT_269971 [Amniculicola lignicola CBS 123094]|uniref:Anaphase-promoting complex subunit 11 n=1 Tax=Amniculicola lignicola CBS 123094 TaxID=1392246 RepID=A0A6A5WCN5_9PLEO|nr:hypothetical protein P154DRAFT_269971 [Amniculicola lignicola CBS 123094]